MSHSWPVLSIASLHVRLQLLLVVVVLLLLLLWLLVLLVSY
jgi:hypothetical protein